MRILSTETVSKVGEEVILKGWVNNRRDMGQVVFLDLRDRAGLVQVVCVPGELDETSLSAVKKVRSEFVLEIHGLAQERGEKQKNEKLATGTVEVLAKQVIILNEAKTPPFELDKNTAGINEETRLQYRYLDLRSERLAKNIRTRDQVVAFFRDYMRKNDFIEIETPLLTKGTPEGAREFLVPSRLSPGEFYVLPQSPQQFKQLLMVAGFERYFQIARCFRDEDQRGDRQPEFTQLDFEMSFVERDDILTYTEKMFKNLVTELFPTKTLTFDNFPVLTYAEAQEKYHSDKPDLRQDKNNPDELAFAWVVDFPMFEKKDDGTIDAMHHPFCDVHPDDIDKLDSDPLSVRANSYDLVLNGYELSSGSIRIHKRDLQKKIFEILGIDEDAQQKKFGHILEAFEYGAPPHGGFAPGIDRVVMLLMGEPNIREVMAFPKTGDAKDLLMGAPSSVSERALKDANIKVSFS